MVNPKTIVEGELYKNITYANIFAIELEKGNKDDTIIKLVSRCHLLQNRKKEAYPPSAKWEILTNGNNVVLRNQELTDENGIAAEVSMQYSDFVDQVIMRGIPIKDTFINTPVVFFKESENLYYNIEVEGSVIEKAFQEAFANGWHKRIKTLKPGTVYKVLDKCLYPFKPCVLVENYTYLPKKATRELMYIGKSYSIQSNLSVDIKSKPAGGFDSRLFLELGGKIKLEESKYSPFFIYKDVHLFKDMVSGAYLFSTDKGHNYFPFEKMYTYNEWQGEDAEVAKANSFMEQSFYSQMNELAQKAKEIYYKVQESGEKELESKNNIPSRICLSVLFKEEFRAKEKAKSIFLEAFNRNSDVFMYPNESILDF